MATDQNAPSGSDTPSSESLTNKSKTIFLHILSPSSEIANKLSFPSLPSTTTVGDLKNKVRDAVVSKPSTERMRLIHQGRVVARDSDTMKDVLGQEAIDNPVAHSLHLVLRPPATDPAGSRTPLPTATSHLRPSTPSQTPFGNHTQLENQQQPTPPIDPQSNIRNDTGTFENPHQPNHRVYNNVPLPQGALPPQFQNMLNQHFAAVNRHTAQHANQFRGPIGFPSGPLAPGNNQQAAFQNLVAQQQQARALAGLQGMAGNNAEMRTNAGENSVPGINTQDTNATQPQNPFPPGNHNAFTREGQGPNGQRWQITVNESTMTMPNALNIDALGQGTAGLAPVTPGATSDIDGTFQAAALSASVPMMFNSLPPHQDGNPHQAVHLAHRQIQDAAVRLQQRLHVIEGAIARGTPPSEGEMTEARSQLDSYIGIQTTLRDNLRSSLNSRISEMSRRAEQARNASHATPTIINNENTPSIPGVQTASTTTTLNSLNPPGPVVYLLSSPTGPQALLLSPSGTYTTPLQTISFTTNQTASNPILRTNNIQPAAQTFDRHEPQHANSLNANPAAQPQPQPQPNQVANHEAQPQDANVNANANDNNEARDLLRLLAPLGGHLWLLIRLLGFVWFFTAGGGWRRMTLLALGAFIVFAANTGIFNGLQQLIWDPIRRHLEALVPLAGQNQQERDRQAVASAREGQGQANRRPGEPDPSEAAERLIREHRARPRGWLRQSMRSVERAVAIFVASLVPGVGERHIAAREEAEAVRLVEERIREEGERDTDERDGTTEAGGDAQEQEAGGPGEGVSGQNSAAAAGASGSGESQEQPSQQQQRQQQHPVVEV
ncbi:MAG: hypothetical protein M1827_003412 [Pycnora praestabilis]|nr:MAG: hypothetical protein M1827_003412 [Pycnora praestabilis]